MYLVPKVSMSVDVLDDVLEEYFCCNSNLIFFVHTQSCNRDDLGSLKNLSLN